MAKKKATKKKGADKLKLKRKVVSSKGKCLVSLPGSASVVVAVNVKDEDWKDQAFEKFKAVTGVISSDRQPTFKLNPSSDIIADATGLVVNENGSPVFDLKENVGYNGDVDEVE